MYSTTVSVSVLVKTRHEAYRRRAWFTVLNRIERAVINLTIHCVTELRSTILIEIVNGLIAKMRRAMKNPFQRRAEAVGRVRAQKISELALSWGNASAGEWALDPYFPQYLAIIDKNPLVSTQL